MSFDWMDSKPAPRRANGENGRRISMYKVELTQRAGLYYRLGYPPSRAVNRLVANVDWDFEVGCGGRPDGLSDDDIAEIVKTTYARRPAR